MNGPVGHLNVAAVLGQILKVDPKREATPQGDSGRRIDIPAPFTYGVPAVVVQSGIIFEQDRNEGSDRLLRADICIHIPVPVRPLKSIVHSAMKTQKTQERVVLAHDGEEAGRFDHVPVKTFDVPVVSLRIEPYGERRKEHAFFEEPYLHAHSRRVVHFGRAAADQFRPAVRKPCREAIENSDGECEKDAATAVEIDVGSITPFVDHPRCRHVHKEPRFQLPGRTGGTLRVQGKGGAGQKSQQQEKLSTHRFTGRLRRRCG